MELGTGFVLDLVLDVVRAVSRGGALFTVEVRGDLGQSEKVGLHARVRCQSFQDDVQNAAETDRT